MGSITQQSALQTNAEETRRDRKEMKILRLGLLFLFALSVSLKAEWRLLPSEEGPAGSLGRHVRVLAKESETGERAQLHFAIFDSNKTMLRMIDQPDERRDLASAMSSGQYLAGVNGGYFDPDYQPVGLLVSDGRTITPFRRARLLSGVLSVVNGRIRLQRASEFSMKGKVSEAVQCGPFLVDHGKSVIGLDESRSARRTFVAAGSANVIALGYSSSLSLAELSRVLTSGKITDNLRIDRAMNLDGGSSSAFWFKDGNTPFSISEQKTVRDFVAIVAK
jgi:uncharacterized protein YigE (DUF2233 family)